MSIIINIYQMFLIVLSLIIGYTTLVIFKVAIFLERTNEMLIICIDKANEKKRLFKKDE